MSKETIIENIHRLCDFLLVPCPGNLGSLIKSESPIELFDMYSRMLDVSGAPKMGWSHLILREPEYGEFKLYCRDNYSNTFQETHVGFGVEAFGYYWSVINKLENE